MVRAEPSWVSHVGGRNPNTQDYLLLFLLSQRQGAGLEVVSITRLTATMWAHKVNVNTHNFDMGRCIYCDLTRVKRWWSLNWRSHLWASAVEQWIKLLCVMSVSHSIVLVSNSGCSVMIQLPAKIPGKVAKDGRYWDPAIHMGDLGGISSSSVQPSPTSAVIITWEAKQ